MVTSLAADDARWPPCHACGSDGYSADIAVNVVRMTAEARGDVLDVQRGPSDRKGYFCIDCMIKQLIAEGRQDLADKTEASREDVMRLRIDRASLSYRPNHGLLFIPEEMAFPEDNEDDPFTRDLIEAMCKPIESVPRRWPCKCPCHEPARMLVFTIGTSTGTHDCCERPRVQRAYRRNLLRWLRDVVR